MLIPSVICRPATALVLLFLLPGLPRPASAQGSFARIEGKVYDRSGFPVAGAAVEIHGTARTTLTDPDGFYAIDFVPPGTVTLRASADGRIPQSQGGIRVRPGALLRRDFQLDALTAGPEPGAAADLAVDEMTLPATSSGHLLDGALIDRLPVDRVEDALRLEPGITATARGALSFRGGRPGETGYYIDGIPVNPGARGSGPALAPNRLLGFAGTRVALGTNGIHEVALITGPLPASLGNARAGAVLAYTRAPGTRAHAEASVETDEVFGTLHGPGFNRVEFSAGGMLTPRLGLVAGGVLTGQSAAEGGPGSERTPVFVRAGLDLTVPVPSTPGDPNSDTTYVNTYQFAVSRGHCDAFGSSANPGIRANYGVDCKGIRLPSTTESGYQLSGRAEYVFSARSRLGFLALLSQEQRRAFDYRLFYNPQALEASRRWSRVYALSFSQSWGRADRPVVTGLTFSWQADRALAGPLTTEGELATRDAFGGFLLAPLDFRFDFESFPLDDALVRNYRQNIPGSRRSPYDLENPGQYALVDRYRNNPYGLPGFAESGGPVGRLILHREERLLGQATVSWRLAPAHTLEAGLEAERYDITSYTHRLTSQAYSDLYDERPARQALYVQDRLQVARITLVAGVRYEHYRSNAARPFVLDTVSSSPGFGRYHWFPSPASYGTGGVTFNGRPLVRYVEDGGHGALSPRIQAAFAAGPRTTVRAGYAREAQVPDLGLVLTGLNTDLRITAQDQPFGSDLGFERTAAFELGVEQAIGRGFRLDAALYSRERQSALALATVAIPDPARLGLPTDVSVVTNRGIGQARGLEVRIDGRLGRWLEGFVGYSYQDARVDDDVPEADSRPHTLAGIVQARVPDGWRPGSVAGAMLRGLTVAVAFRYASGTAYTRCTAVPANSSVTAGEPCPAGIAGGVNDARLPAFRQLDLRLQRQFDLGGRRLTAFLDARNLLGFENTTSVFAATGEARSAADRQLRWSADSASYAGAASYNGVYDGPTGAMDLRFGGAGTGGCLHWTQETGQPAAPDCIYLVRAEERFGDGDLVFTQAEQRRASRALYDVDRGRPTFLGQPRRLRAGLQVSF